mgnify:CR=1 FL=1
MGPASLGLGARGRPWTPVIALKSGVLVTGQNGKLAHLAVDSLKFISLDGLYRAVGEAEGRNKACPQYCDACFSGEYPVTPADMIEKGFEMKAAE